MEESETGALVCKNRIPAPFRVAEDATVSLSEIDNLEYHLILDPEKVEERLAVEAEAAQKQQREKVDGEDGRESDTVSKEFVSWWKENFERTRNGPLIISSREKLVCGEVRDFFFQGCSSTSGQAGAALIRGEGNSAMEDFLLYPVNFDFLAAGATRQVAVSGVFDGHGSYEVAQYSRDNIGRFLQKRLEEFGEKGLDDVAVWNALKLAFVDLSRECCSEFVHEEWSGDVGATASVAVMIEGVLWVVNLGDSRTLLVDPDGKTLQLSEDQKCSDERYKKGVQDRGHDLWVDLAIANELRLDGNLGMPRALGNHRFAGGCSGRPKITRFEMPKGGWRGYHLVHCSDGITDLYSSTTIGTVVHNCVEEKLAPVVTAAVLAGFAWDKNINTWTKGSCDDIGVVVCAL
ncbi:protein serine/threonine phosphatase 2C family protein [Simkania negevensis]|uniref:Protein serine/threonine phosphatase 2C family protein n=1 Tax=Simkania negevensis TaxID=83561 RepID=A0ABS3AVJ6_9BACT|nr:protein serine/threonine phosphatase 2C family protein [Simkania negevensis]